MIVDYHASPTASQFHGCNMFVRSIIGPIGSGKSVACVIEILKRIFEQEPNKQGIRKTRVAVIRNTYRELLDTTMLTFFDWIPKHVGSYSVLQSKFVLNLSLPDGTTVYSEILFRALDKPSDVKKLLSLELTFAWINEVRELPKQILDMLIGRVGRYPSKREGGPSWYGIIVDTNACDSDHWFYNLFEEELPDNFSIFHQPSGLSPEAENIENLPLDYYKNMLSGKSKEWINVYVHGKYGFIMEGMPIFPEFIQDIHVLERNIEVNKNYQLYVGLDFGRTPAAIFAQNINGQWIFLDEIITKNMGAEKFAKILGKKLRKDYRGIDIEIYGDPSGGEGNQVNEDTPFLVLGEAGIEAHPAPSQDPVIRREALATQMTSICMTGKPVLAINPRCITFVRGLGGGYQYKRLQVAGEERYHSVPDKNKFSHVCEAAEYLLVGAGEDVTWIGNHQDWSKLDFSNLDNAA